MQRGLGDHAVQFYERDDFLAEQLTDFFAPALRAGAAGVVIATPLHRRMLEARLAEAGVPPGRMTYLDAAETLASFLSGRSPDPVRFRDAICPVLAEARRRGNGRVVAFGEMVALLWADGNSQGALDLEQLWTEVGREEAFDLLCAHPLQLFARAEDRAPFDQVLESHGEVRPTESYLRLSGEEVMRREVARLQQRSAVLAAEIARRTSIEAELARAAAQKDEFIAVLAHELRNPLTPVLLGLELARHEAPHSRHIPTVARHARLMAHLVEDLLDVARLVRGKIELRRSLVALDVVLARGAELAGPLVQQRRHQLVVDAPEGVVLDGDVDRLSQVVGNLLQNAAKYTAPGGRIDLRARVEGGDVVIDVADNGEGLSEQVARRLFVPFSQANPGRGGLGLGLSVARIVVELHGGTIQAASPGPGRGSTFTVRLPLPLVRVEERDAGAAHEVPEAPQRRVVVIDDNGDVAETVGEVLRLDGHEVRTATDGATGVALAAAWEPDVVLCDLAMQPMDGFEVARRLRADARLADCVLVAMTGFAQRADQERSLAAGFDHHLPKPPEAHVVRRLVASARRAATTPR